MGNFNPNEPRDERGRWTNGLLDGDIPESELLARAHSVLAHAASALGRLSGFEEDQATAKRLVPILKALWFRNRAIDWRDLGARSNPDTFRTLQAVAELALQAHTLGNMIRAGEVLAGVVRGIGGSSAWQTAHARMEMKLAQSDQSDALTTPGRLETIGQDLWDALNPIGTAHAQVTAGWPQAFNDQV